MSNLKLKHTPRNYTEAATALGTKDSMPIGHNTRLERNGPDEIVATYHNNPIVSYTPSGVWVTWAGWPTNTTTTRLHMLAPARFNIKNREPHLNGVQVSASEWIKVAE